MLCVVCCLRLHVECHCFSLFDLMLLVVRCSWCVVGCALWVVCWLLGVVSCLMRVAYSVLFVVRCLSSVVLFSPFRWFVVCCLLCVV